MNQDDFLRLARLVVKEAEAEGFLNTASAMRQILESFAALETDFLDGSSITQLRSKVKQTET